MAATRRGIASGGSMRLGLATMKNLTVVPPDASVLLDGGMLTRLSGLGNGEP